MLGLSKLARFFAGKDGNASASKSAALIVEPPSVAHHVPSYPPTDPGIPFVAVDAVVASQKELIDKIMKAAALDPISQKFVPELIRNFAAFVHLLPATQSQQYPGNGGLFRMGLEVGFHSLRSSHGVMFASEIAEVRVKTIPRWRIATLVAGLLADTYRAITSMSIITSDGGQWNPFTESLAAYLEKSGGDRYYIKWVKDSKDNQSFNNLVVGAVVPHGLLSYLGSTGPQIVGAMLEAITGTGSTPLAAAVKRTRDGLIKRDVQSNPNFVGRPMMGSHLEANIVDAMRRLVREGKWQANQNGQPLWNGPDGLFLVIQSGWRDLYSGLMSGGFSGIPTDFEVIAEILLNAGILVPAMSGGYVYEVKIPAFGKKTMEAVKLTSGIKAFGDAFKGFTKLDAPLIAEAKADQAPQLEVDEFAEEEGVGSATHVASSDDDFPFDVVETPKPKKVGQTKPPKAADPATPAMKSPVTTPSPKQAPKQELPDDDLPSGTLQKGGADEFGNTPPDVSSLLDGWDGDDFSEVPTPSKAISVSSPLTRSGFNDVAWTRYGAKMPPDVAEWIEGAVRSIVAGNESYVIREDGYGVKASLIDQAGLGRGLVLNAMVNGGLIWIAPGQSKKLVDVDGEQHVFFNRRFISEVTK